MLNEAWVRNEIGNILEIEENSAIKIDAMLAELIKHSLKMVTFLARFHRVYGKNPEILVFIQNPTFETLKKSLA